MRTRGCVGEGAALSHGVGPRRPPRGLKNGGLGPEQRGSGILGQHSSYICEKLSRETVTGYGMRKNVWFWLTVALTVGALVASAILLVDYVRPGPVFCDAGGGCGKIKQTVFARPFGVPLPAIGLAGILGIGCTALVAGRRARLVQLVLGGFGGVAALALLGVQAAMGVFCPYCAIVDGAAIGLAVLSFVRFRKELDPPGGRIVLGAVVVALMASVAVPTFVGLNRKVIPSHLPAAIAEEMKISGSGKVTIVDFLDFECPFCRMTHTELAPVLEAHKDKVRVARKHVPLRIHPHAMNAAKASHCGELLGKGDEIADALFNAPPEDLTPEGCEKIAKDHGLDLEKYRACVDAPATAARIEKDKEAFRAVDGQGLPTIWIDEVKLEGAQDRATLESVVEEAIRAL